MKIDCFDFVFLFLNFDQTFKRQIRTEFQKRVLGEKKSTKSAQQECVLRFGGNNGEIKCIGYFDRRDRIGVALFWPQGRVWFTVSISRGALEFRRKLNEN